MGGDPGSPAEPPGRRLTARDLNRATLARQLLLARAAIDPVTAIGRVVALQAQEPASPYIALWTRLAGFDPDRLDAMITARRVVKATLMRMTLHMVTAADYPAFWTAHARPSVARGCCTSASTRWGSSRPRSTAWSTPRSPTPTSRDPTRR